MHATDALAADDQLSRGISRSFATSGFPANGKYLIRPIVRRVQSGKILINFPKRIEEKERERERERERETVHKLFIKFDRSLIARGSLLSFENQIRRM